MVCIIGTLFFVITRISLEDVWLRLVMHHGHKFLNNGFTVPVLQVLEDYQSPADLERQAATGSPPSLHPCLALAIWL